jgi:AraC-like DNA-binding protein
MGLSFQNQTLSLPSDRTGRIDSILFSQIDRFRFTAPGGRLETRTIRFPERGLKIGRVESTGHDIALTEENAASFLMPARGHARVRGGHREWEADATGLLALRPGQRETSVQNGSDAKYRGHVLILPYADLIGSPDAARKVEALFQGQLGAQLAGPAANRLRHTLAFAVDDLLASPTEQITDRVIHGLLTLLDDLLQDLLDIPPDSALLDAATADRLHARRARHALDILQDRSDEPLSIAELARELGIGIRSLQMIFVKSYGIGPREMLNRIRLDRARHRLLTADPDTQVTTVALDSGFTHLSRFSEAYRRRYGERPIDTLRHKPRH